MRPRSTRKTRVQGRWTSIEPLEDRRLLAAVIYVDWIDYNGDDANDGASWQSAYVDLQAALAAAVSGDEIRVADGVYKPTAGMDRTISFHLKSGVKLLGGYAGYGSAHANTRNITSHATILSGDIGTPGDATDNSYNVVVASFVDAAASLDGFTITGGHADGLSQQGQGGGMYLYRSALTINNCTFTANFADSGGGLYARGEPSPVVTGTTFIDNSATLGGGVYTFSSSATFSACTFSGNSATAGGGMYNSSSTPSLTDCTFTVNTAGDGGGIYNNYADASLMRCTFIRNTASFTGGAIANNGSDGSVSHSTFLGNLAGSYGGGVSNASSSPTFFSSVFAGNSASNGGGMYNNDAGPSIVNSTFTGNAAAFGGALSNSNSDLANVTNSILWGNNGGAVFDYFSAPSIGQSLVEGGYAGEGIINGDPQFARAPDPGPDGDWGTTDDDYGDLRLMPASPGIDAGDNTAVPLDSTDLDGRPRLMDLPDVGGTGAIVDLGAYETLPPIVVSGSTDLYVRLSADQQSLHIWSGSAPIGEPAQTHLFSSVASCTFNTGPGPVTIRLDFSNGSPISAAGMTIAGDPADELIALADENTRGPLLEYLRSRLAAGRISSSFADLIHGLRMAYAADDDILIQLAIHGDLNADGALDGDDYFAMDQVFLMAAQAPPEADLNYDGAVDAADYFLMDRAFLELSAMPAPAAVAAPLWTDDASVWDELDGPVEGPL